MEMTSADALNSQFDSDRIGRIVTSLELLELDYDLTKEFKGVYWARIPTEELMRIQQVRLLRKLLSVVEQRNDGNKR